MIDGGMSRPYQRETGIAGYTLVSNSYGMRLVAYEPFSSTEDAIRNETDIHSATEVVQKTSDRLSIRDTDVAEEMMAYTKNNILIQSAQAMLAQANQVPQGVLQLLG